MKHRLLTSVVAVVLALFMGASAAAQSGSNSRYYQFADTAAASVSNPASGRVRLFFDSTGFYWKNSAGVSTAVGGSSISGTAGVIPAIATGGTSLEDSKMTTSGTNGGTWTLYDDTAVTGVTSLDIKPGAGQHTASSPLLSIYDTYTDASNYNRLAVSVSTAFNSIDISQQAAGSGANRHMRINVGGGALYINAGGLTFLGGTYGFTYDAGAVALYPSADNIVNLGSSGNAWKNGYVSTSIQGTRTQAISDNAAAATFVTIAVPTSNTTVGGRIFYTITAIDAGTAIQTKTGTYSFGLNNIGGTVTGAGTDVLEHSQLSAGTLAPTFSVNISGTNAQFQLVLDTSLDAAAETLKIEYRVQIDSGTATVTPAT